MTRSVLGRVFGVALLFYLLAFAAFFVYSLIAFRAAPVLSSFHMEYVARRALLLFAPPAPPAGWSRSAPGP